MISGSTSTTINSSTSNNSTHIKLLDLTAKYEEFEQKYNRIKLENNQYKQYIQVIEQQKEDLKAELLQYQKDDCSEFQPILQDHITSIQTSLQHHDNEIESLSGKLSDQSQLVKKLRLQIAELSQQNNQYREALEINNKKIKLKQRIGNDKSESQQNKINLLTDENEILKEELATLRAMTCFKSSIDSSNVPVPPKIALTKSIDEHVFHVDTMSPRAPLPTREPTIDVTADSLAQIIKYQTLNMIDIEQYGIGTDRTERTDRILLNDIQIKMEKLENENIELKELLEEFKSEQCKFIDESDVDEEDNKTEYDELHDLEQLFQKISSTHTHKLNNNNNLKIRYESRLIEKFRIMCFELQLRRITRRNE